MTDEVRWVVDDRGHRSHQHVQRQPPPHPASWSCAGCPDHEAIVPCSTECDVRMKSIEVAPRPRSSPPDPSSCAITALTRPNGQDRPQRPRMLLDELRAPHPPKIVGVDIDQTTTWDPSRFRVAVQRGDFGLGAALRLATHGATSTEPTDGGGESSTGAADPRADTPKEPMMTTARAIRPGDRSYPPPVDPPVAGVPHLWLLEDHDDEIDARRAAPWWRRAWWVALSRLGVR